MAGTTRTAHRSLTALVVGALLTALAVTGLAAVPAQAVELAAPTGLTPVSGSFGTNPTLAWNRVPGAASYRVELATNDSFSPLISSAGTATTVNNRFVPPVQLPAGTIYWRVAANGSVPVNWALGSFDRDTVGVPTLLTPAESGTIHAPTEPEAYTWTPVPGATGYNLQVGDDESFTDPARYKEYPTKRASYTLKTLPAPGTKYWRVQALLSTTVKGDWSAARRLDVALFDQGLPLEPTQPANDANVGIDEVDLDWPAVPGATTYDVQVATDDQFLNLAHSRTGVVGSRYSPPGALANDQYWWRIRPVDAAGHQGPWAPSAATQPWTFQRHWPDQAQLQYPADGATISRHDRVFFQWSGVHLATSYRLDLSTTPDFTEASTDSCTTVNTSFTPFWLNSSVDDCRPLVGTAYWWRVVANDSPAAGVNTPQTNPLAPSAQVHSFTYLPNHIDGTAPADGASVDVPTMKWPAVGGAEKYKVSVWSVSSGTVLINNQPTYGTSLTPRTALSPGTYRWQVVGYNAAGAQITNGIIAEFQDTFTVVSPFGLTSAAPDANPGGSGKRPPTLTWARTTGATSYTVWMKRSENPTWTQAIATTAYPAGEPWEMTQFLAAGTYDFYVVATTGGGSVTGAPSTFTVTALPTPAGHNAALVGTDIDSADATRSCDATLPQTCENLRQTPVLAWDTNADTGSYKLILSADPVLTDDIDRVVPVYGSMWTDIATLADANASSGTYWDVIPCVTQTVCPITSTAKHVFNKQGPRVQLESPASSSAHPYEVTLSWHDWLAAPDLAGAASTPLTATAPTTEARFYEVQTATSADFTTGVLDSAVRVDGTEFTSWTVVYPDGPIHWRVRAFDGSARPGAWSPARTFTVASLAPTQTSPAAGTAFGPGSAFAWQPRALSASYELRVLKNDGSSIDTAPAASIALNVTGIQQTSYAPTEHLPVIAPPTGTTNNYRWFIRRKSVSGGVGPWSAEVPFRVTGQAPVQQSPAAAAVVPPKGGLFTWGAVDGAASYRFEDHPVGGSVTFATTVALAYAPTAAVTGSAREWRVLAYDASGNVLGASPWRGYSASPISGSVTMSGQPRVNGTLTAAASFSPTGTAISYQWYSGATAIAGATGTTYTVKSVDVGKAISVRATGAKSGYDPVTVISNSMTATQALAVTNTAKPAITGTTKVGYYLTSSLGSWSPTPEGYAFQWLRNGAAITGATARTYRLTLADLGRTLAVRVIARKTGYTSGVATSVGKAIPRITTTTRVSLLDNTIRTATYPQMRITVIAPGLANPTGTVRVYEGTTLLKSGTLGATARGVITLTLPRRSVGSHYLYAKYAGSAYTLPSTSAKVLLSVSR